MSEYRIHFHEAPYSTSIFFDLFNCVVAFFAASLVAIQALVLVEIAEALDVGISQFVDDGHGIEHVPGCALGNLVAFRRPFLREKRFFLTVALTGGAVVGGSQGFVYFFALTVGGQQIFWDAATQVVSSVAMADKACRKGAYPVLLRKPNPFSSFV